MTDLTGGCLCGAVQYRVEDAFRYALTCHCSKCRKATGAAHKTFGGIEREKLSLTQGADGLLVWGDPQGVEDVRCGTCGSLLWSVVRAGKWAHVTYGTLDANPTKQPTDHIFTASRAEWDTICDGLPQHDASG